MNYDRAYRYFNPIPAKSTAPPQNYNVAFGTIGVGTLIVIIGLSSSEILGIALGLSVSAVGSLVALYISVLNKKAIAEAKSFNDNREWVSDEEMDLMLRERLKSFEDVARRKLGIDEEQVREADPIRIDGYYFRDVFSHYPETKRGEDGRTRTSAYNAVMFFFSAEQVFCYECKFSLLGDETKEKTEEYFYGDIVSIATRTDMKDEVSFEEFTLTTSGGTTISATFYNEENVERSIQAMKNLIRNKKR